MLLINHPTERIKQDNVQKKISSMFKRIFAKDFNVLGDFAKTTDFVKKILLQNALFVLVCLRLCI